ncbi:variable surface protein [Plasmodium gonderi]|uniref:Variable surface protein n=1 Tax=Plasmodium gonderi TaxID=77519 RepID=A0A1Y1JTX0_PLAGO|nr:variable surface protein [Plasmodium gonderi]GAW84202.1 variable surface protein [Plasmodium gonderi]
MGVDLGDEALNSLPSKKKYTIFDIGDVGCDNFHYYKLAKESLLGTQLLNDAYNKILKALCYIYKAHEARKIGEDDCHYLYFWLGDALDKNLINRISFPTHMETLKFLLNSDDGKKICDYNKYNMTKQNFMDIKNLFDLLKDYDELKKYFNSPINSCNSNFQIHLDGYVMTYRQCHNSCNDIGNSEDTCKFFKQYFKSKEQMDILNWKCNSEEITGSLSARQRYHGKSVQTEVQIIDAQTQTQSQSQSHINLEPVPVPDPVPELEIELHPDTVRVPQLKHEEELLRRGTQEGPHMEVQLRKTYEDEGGEHLKYENLEHTNLYSRDPQSSTTIGISDDPSAFSSPKSMVIAPLVIGITVLSIILCKFTPFGYWLKKALLGKPQRKRNIIMDKNKIEDYSITEDIESLRRFNIKYSNI